MALNAHVNQSLYVVFEGPQLLPLHSESAELPGAPPPLQVSLLPESGSVNVRRFSL